MATAQCIAERLHNPYCSHGYNMNHSCRQCLKRSLEAWGYDADAYDAYALRETARRRAAAHRQRWENDSDAIDKYRLRTYNLPAQTYVAMLAEQGGRCAICCQPETSAYKGKVIALAVDHDHETGQVRGLLCARCNVLLGAIERRGGLGYLYNIAAYLYEDYVQLA